MIRGVSLRSTDYASHYQPHQIVQPSELDFCTTVCAPRHFVIIIIYTRHNIMYIAIHSILEMVHVGIATESSRY